MNIKFLTKVILTYSLILGFVSSCTMFGGTKNKGDGIANFITGTAVVDNVQNVHIINLIRAIGAPNNSTIIGGYKYYQWQHGRSVGFSTLFGGGSTTLYCNLTAETRRGKIKIINWYGNQCGIFLDPMNDYFADKLNIAVIADENDKTQNIVTSKPNSSKSELKNSSPAIPSEKDESFAE